MSTLSRSREVLGLVPQLANRIVQDELSVDVIVGCDEIDLDTIRLSDSISFLGQRNDVTCVVLQNTPEGLRINERACRRLIDDKKRVCLFISDRSKFNPAQRAIRQHVEEAQITLVITPNGKGYHIWEPLLRK